MIRYIDHQAMREVCHRLAVDLFDKIGEPIASFDSADKALLESSLAAPAAGFGDHEQYPDVHAKAAVLLYSLIKNHAFENGNKRIAITALFVFLSINGYVLNASQDALVSYARNIAASDRSHRDRILANATRWIRTNTQSNE